MGKGTGLLAGILGGVADTLQQKQKQKHDDQLEGQRQLGNVFLKAIDAGDLDPQVGYPLVAQIISGSYKANVGDTGKGGKGAKGGNDLAGFVSKLMGDPQNLSSLLMGAHGALSTYQKGGAETGGQDVAKGMPANPITGQASAESSPARKSIFLSADDKLKLQSAADQAHAEGQALGSTRGKMRAAQELVQQGMAKDIDEAMERVGLKEPRTTALKPGSVADILQTKTDDFEAVNGRKPTPKEREQLIVDANKELQASKTTARPSSDPTEKRSRELMAAEGIDPTKATEAQQTSYRAKAAKEIRSERVADITDKRKRTNAALASAGLSQSLRKEQLNLLRETAPFTAALREQNVFNAQDLGDLREASKETKGEIDPVKIVSTAASKAEAAYAKKGVISTFLSDYGIAGESREDMEDRLIEEMTGGADAATIRALAKQKSEKGTGAAGAGAGGAPAKKPTPTATGLTNPFVH